MLGFAQENCFTNSFQNIQNSLTAVSNRLSTVASSLIQKNNLPIYLQDFTFNSSDLSVVNSNIVGGIPTSTKYGRTWNMILYGTLVGNNSGQYILNYDFSSVNSQYSIKFDGPVTGTVVIGGNVLDAVVVFPNTPILGNNNTFSLVLEYSGIPVGTSVDFYYNIFIADKTCCGSRSECTPCVL